MSENNRIADPHALKRALFRLYRWCNNVEIRGEGMHAGPIWFTGPAGADQQRTIEDDDRWDALRHAEDVLGATPSIDRLQPWRPIDEAPHAIPVILGWWKRWPENEWLVEVGVATAGGNRKIEDSGRYIDTYSRHARATHFMRIPTPPPVDEGKTE